MVNKKKSSSTAEPTVAPTPDLGSDLYKTRNRHLSKRKNAEEERELEEKTLGFASFPIRAKQISR